MAKEFEMNMPQDVVHEYLLKSGYKHSLGNKQEIVFANLCATWGANQEYEAAHQYILGAVGEGNARIYQEKRRPRILTQKEKALEALDYIDEMAIYNMKSYTCYEELKKCRCLLYQLIGSMPEEDAS